jgi:hypothetical protein
VECGLLWSEPAGPSLVLDDLLGLFSEVIWMNLDLYIAWVLNALPVFVCDGWYFQAARCRKLMQPATTDQCHSKPLSTVS